MAHVMDVSNENGADAPGVPPSACPAEIAELREENARLVEALRDLSHAQLISRDTELGLRAELLQAKIAIRHAHDVAAAEVSKVRQSTTWRVGRVVTKPLSFFRRFVRPAK